MNFENKLLIISLMGVIILWHCRSRPEPDGSPPGPTGPDLIVEAGATPTDARPSGEVSLEAMVTNMGAGDSDGTTLNWYFSADKALDTGSDTLAGTEPVSSLAAAASSGPISSMVTVPDMVGTYYYFACVESVADESDTDNNCSSAVRVEVTPRPVPDLSVNISPTNANAAFSEPLTLEATVRNTGTGSSPPTTLIWYLSDDATITAADMRLSTSTSSGLAAGASGTVAYTVTAPSMVGSHYYGACVGAVTGEADTTNNCSGAVTVAVTVPDLSVSVAASSTAVSSSQEITLTATVSNAGTRTSEATKLKWYLSADNSLDTAADTEVGTEENVAIVAAGANVMISNSSTIMAPRTVGTHYYFACAASVTAEADITNNCSTGAAVTVTAPDLVVSILPATATVESSGMLTLMATVMNTGNRDSAAIILRWYSSADSTVDTTDIQFGTDVSVNSVAAGASSSAVSSGQITVSATGGTDYYGACVVQVSPDEADESDTANNCFTVTVAVTTAPDLVVAGISPASVSVLVSGTTTLMATVENEGTKASPATADLTWYRSDDNSLETDTDTKVKTQEDEVDILQKSGVSGDSETISYMVTVPATAGTYYYFACVDTVTDESNTDNNCSTAATVIVGAPDFAARITTVSAINLAPGAMTTLMAVVSNVGVVSSMGTLRWYGSTDGTITTSDTKVGTDVSVSDLAADATSGMLSSGALTVSTTAGTYYYGACVIDVTNETNTANNCSSAVTVIVSSLGTSTARLEAFDFNGLQGQQNAYPVGLWSDRVTLWVADYVDSRLYAYDLATKSRDSAKNFYTLETAGNERPTGIWSDGTTMWVADSDDDKLYAYNLASKARDPDKDFTTLIAAGNTDPQGIWSDGTTMWVVDSADNKLYAYTILSEGNYGNRASAKDITLEIRFTASGGYNRNPSGLWSDGTHIWVSDRLRSKLFTYKLSDGTRSQNEINSDFNTLSQSRNGHPRGIWSDGTTIWVANNPIEGNTPGISEDKIFAYSAATGVHDKSKDFNSLYTEGDGNEDPRGAWSDGVTLWVADSTDDKIYAYSAVNRFRDSAKDVALATENTDARGLWSNSTTMWVADSGDDKLYAYRMSDRARDSAKDITLATDNADSQGLWSNGTTMWVADSADNKLYAYVLTTGARDSAKDITLAAGNTDASGLWSDGTTMWVADLGDDKLYAYTLSSGSYVSGKDVTALSSGNTDPQGIWSDRSTLWVVDNPSEEDPSPDGVPEGNSENIRNDKIYAYDIRSLITP